MDRGFGRLDSKIDGVERRLDARIDGLDAKVDRLAAHVIGHDARFERLERRLDHMVTQDQFSLAMDRIYGKLESMDRSLHIQLDMWRNHERRISALEARP